MRNLLRKKKVWFGLDGLVLLGQVRSGMIDN